MSSPRSRTPSAARRLRVGPPERVVLLVIVVGIAGVLVHAAGWDDVHVLRRAARSGGPTGAALFALGYAGLTLTPLPKNALSATAGLVFGFTTGLLVVWSGAFTGAMTAFVLARWLRRGTHVAGGRLARLDALLSRRGLLGAVVVRLVPVLPFTAVNYGSGLSTLRVRHYALGTAVGIVPGSMVFVGLGAGILALPGWLTVLLAVPVVAFTLGTAGWRARRRRRSARGG